MIHLNTFDDFIINESLSSDASEYLQKLFHKIKDLSFEKKKTLVIYALSGLLLATNSSDILKIINSNDFMKSELVSNPQLKKVVIEKLSEESPFKDAKSLKLSEDGWNSIKAEEGDPKKPGDPVLVAYKLGDKRITVGWGHSELIKNSKYQVGQKITRQEAKSLLKKDLKVAADGVRRMFKKWKDSGIDRKITQDQFDALVSIAFNLGITGLVESEIDKELKKGNYEEAGRIITRSAISKKFPGLEKRRKRESELFLSYLEDSDKSESPSNS